MNKVILTGNLCQQVELKQTQGGKSVVSNCIAVTRDYRNANGEYDTDFINITVWGQQAEYLSRNGSKGDRVELVGSWSVRKYQANDGTTRTVNECTVESIKVFSKKPQEQPQQAQAAPQAQQFDLTGKELPF